MKPKTISVIGAGYVGLTTATLFAEAGHTVHLIEINPGRLKTIQSGKSFFFEDGIDPLIAHAIKSKKLLPTGHYEQAIPGSDIIFSCVGTPDNPDGSSNLSFVYAAAEEAAKYIKDGAIYVQKSTVPVGTGEAVEKIFERAGKNVSYVSNPEFLREGTAIADTLGFDRIVAGSSDKPAAEEVINLYKTLESKRDEIAKRAKITFVAKAGDYIATNRNSAELIKVTANAFLAMKISFANSIAKLADQAGANVTEVMDAVGADPRIGRAFLNAGRGYGGGCFPKDVSGLISSATEFGVDLPIMTAAADVNESMPGYIANKALERLDTLQGKKLAVLGLAFKSGTSDSRRSPGVKLANILDHDGAEVCVYDPRANGEAKEDLRKSVAICDSLEKATENADAVFITTDWPELKTIDLPSLKKRMQGDLFIDAMNCYNKTNVEAYNLTYVGVGR
ncbi:MAG: UDP-glucose/GDP-mannose dehydrogenase family protein [Candidatus Saccharibacteria bacterium]|nr:UDP-glucose/GDP-mannose dehydrogenase family protein [Candidatus Saccharibacteria bacterium]